MTDEINRFWIPIAQILPVFILGLVVEARITLTPGKQSRAEKKQSDSTASVLATFSAAIDGVARIVYAIMYAVAMAAVVVSFILSIVVLAGGKAGDSSLTIVLVIAIIGALLTGLLPISRLLEDVLSDYAALALLALDKRLNRSRNAKTRGEAD
jgi:hypothetical protein